eukprot:PhF_6_TR5671/c0_g1_i3/m.8350
MDCSGPNTLDAFDSMEVPSEWRDSYGGELLSVQSTGILYKGNYLMIRDYAKIIRYLNPSPQMVSSLGFAYRGDLTGIEFMFGGFVGANISLTRACGPVSTASWTSMTINIIWSNRTLSCQCQLERKVVESSSCSEVFIDVGLESLTGIRFTTGNGPSMMDEVKISCTHATPPSHGVEILSQDGIGYSGKLSSITPLHEPLVATTYDSWPALFIKNSIAFYGGVYDGASIWLIPSNADRVIQ